MLRGMQIRLLWLLLCSTPLFFLPLDILQCEESDHGWIGKAEIPKIRLDLSNQSTRGLPSKKKKKGDENYDRRIIF